MNVYRSWNNKWEWSAFLSLLEAFFGLSLRRDLAMSNTENYSTFPSDGIEKSSSIDSISTSLVVAHDQSVENVQNGSSSSAAKPR